MLHLLPVMRALGLLATLSLLLLASCDGNDRREVESSLLTTTESGDLVIGSGEITSERYKRWLAAARALESVRNLPSIRGLRSGSITANDAERAIAALEAHAGARRALSQAGMSVREYVMTTIALEQQMRVAGPGSRPQSIPAEEFIPPVDSTGLAPLYGPPESLPQPYPEPYPPPEPLPAPTPTIRIPPEPVAPPETLGTPVPRDTLRAPRESPPVESTPTPPTPALPTPTIPRPTIPSPTLTPPPVTTRPADTPPPADSGGPQPTGLN